MKRRQFIQTASATSALGAMALMSGCATIGGANGPKVVVVGGGYGGATAAKYVRMWSDYGIQVTLIEPNASFISCPISNLVIAVTFCQLVHDGGRLAASFEIKHFLDHVVFVSASQRLAA